MKVPDRSVLVRCFLYSVDRVKTVSVSIKPILTETKSLIHNNYTHGQYILMVFVLSIYIMMLKDPSNTILSVVLSDITTGLQYHHRPPISPPASNITTGLQYHHRRPISPPASNITTGLQYHHLLYHILSTSILVLSHLNHHRHHCHYHHQICTTVGIKDDNPATSAINTSHGTIIGCL